MANIEEQAELEAPLESERIVYWRLEQLRDLGFDANEAATMAEDLHVDLAQARKLVALGCPLDTASRILL